MSRDGKPLELPGLYWDDARRRYFPLASKPKRKAIEEEPVGTQVADEDRGRSEGHLAATVRYTKVVRAGINNYSQRARITHEIEGRSLVDSYFELEPPVRPLSWQTSKITSFHAATIDDTLNVLVGDSRGVLHCSRAVIKTASEVNAGADRFNDNSRLFTSYHLGPGTAVTHIVRSGHVAVAVSSMCDSCSLGVRDLQAPDHSGVSFPRINIAGDIRAASLLDRRLAIGISGRVVWVKDIGGPIKGHTSRQTKSDVLSVTQSSSTITAGLRNGEVRLFDMRTRSDVGIELLGSRFSGKGNRNSHSIRHIKSRDAHSAITHLQDVSEWEILVATSAGELEMFDRRFATSSQVQPTMIFKGHVNSYLLDLGITTDPSSSFLFAAGQDCRVRAWSLRTGEQLGTLLGGAQLHRPARALAVTQPDHAHGARRLWIAQDDEVRVVRLGG